MAFLVLFLSFLDSDKERTDGVRIFTLWLVIFVPVLN